MMSWTGVVLAADPEPGTPAQVDLDPAKQPKASDGEASTRDEPSENADRGGSEVSDEDFGHGMQFGLRAGLTGG